MRDIISAIGLMLTLLLIFHAGVNHARLSALEALHTEVVLENQFLARKIAEVENERKKDDLGLKLAVAGFRTGSWWAYDVLITEARRILRTEPEGVVDAQ